ncbi:MAG: hypothetical protein ACP5LQ_05830 [Candidatus Methanodesulfokora sp.]
MSIEVDLVRPVNPAGASFIKYVWGAIGARNRSVIQEHKKELSRLLMKLSFALEDKIGPNKLVTGKVVVELKDGRPVKAIAKDLRVWQETGSVEGEVVVEILPG